jgi:hypothetical protein
MLHPKHTLISVARDLETGIERGTVYLTDEELREAGYETHTVMLTLSGSLWQLVALASILTFSAVRLFTKGGRVGFFALNVAMWGMIIIINVILMLHRRRRYIKRKAGLHGEEKAPSHDG